jgi:CheY-like chemotaxis protein
VYTKGKYEVQNFSDKNVLLYCRTPINIEYISRTLKDLGVTFHIVSDDSDLHNKLTGTEWDFVFAEADMAYTAQYIIKSRELGTKIVMLSDSYDATYEARDGQDFTLLIMPAYFIPIVNVLSGRGGDYSSDNQLTEPFTAPDARILLVDDIETNLKVGEGLLRLYGTSIDTCLSGISAIEAVKSKEYDLVLMDHMMPEMDGVETVKIIRSMGGKYADLPIVALTANAIVGAREMFLANGFNDFLSKPIEVYKLNGILAKWIPKEKQQQSSLSAAQDTKGEEPVISIEGVDAERGISLSGGKTKNYLETLSVFYKDGKAKIKQLTDCLKAGNLTLYTTYVHALKSACANIGALNLSEEAKILEAAGIKNDMEHISSANDGFIADLEKLLENIGKAVSAGSKKPDADFDEAIMNELLTKLKTALENFDVEAIDEATDALQEFAQHPDKGELIGTILQDAFVGKYKRALEALGEIISVV